MELNPTVQFHLLGDKPPKSSIPRNARFHRVRSSELVSRVRAATGVRPPKFALTGWGHTAKVNDIKPLFGVLFAELLQECEWWATMQDDMLLGSVRAFLSAELLARHDLVSPLPAPFFHSGPFMAYRNTEVVNRLWQRSADWQWMLRTPEYVTFDEWWGPAADKDNMPHVVHREAAAGRVRASRHPLAARPAAMDARGLCPRSEWQPLVRRVARRRVAAWTAARRRRRAAACLRRAAVRPLHAREAARARQRCHRLAGCRDWRRPRTRLPSRLTARGFGRTSRLRPRRRRRSTGW